jgi:hypothetical protein
MTSRAAKRAKRQSKRIRAARGQVGNVEDLPRPLRLVVDNQERLADYVSKSTDPAAASARALDDLHTNVDEIVAKMSGHDSLDVLEGIALINLMADPEVYRETEHEGSGGDGCAYRGQRHGRFRRRTAGCLRHASAA